MLASSSSSSSSSTSSSSSSSLVFCPRAGSCHPLPLPLSVKAILFISTYPSLFSVFLLFPLDHFLVLSLPTACFRSPIIPFLGLPARFFPFNLPSITSLNKPYPLNICPIQFFCRCLIVLIRR